MWIDYIRNKNDLLDIYNDIIAIGKLGIRTIFYEDGCWIRITFDLEKFPENIPEKWISKKFNSVSMSINFVNIIELDQNGWQPGNVVDFTVETDEKYKIVMLASSNGLFSIKMKVQDIYISSIEGYISSTYP